MLEIPKAPLYTPLLLTLAALPVRAQEAEPAEDTYKFFETNCRSCHNIGGGDLTGPDLKDVTDRRERDWLRSYIPDPQAMIDSGDPIATQLYEKYKVVMPKIPGIDETLLEDLIDMLAFESGLEESRYMAQDLSGTPFIDLDFYEGELYYTGQQDFFFLGPACVSCHTLGGPEPIPGGTLGPDLTRAYSRLNGRAGTIQWLQTMHEDGVHGLFGDRTLEDEEAYAVTALLYRASQGTVERAPSRALFLLVGGFGAAAVLLGLYELLWNRGPRPSAAPTSPPLKSAAEPMS